MSIDCMTSYEKRDKFVTKILPSLPFSIIKDHKIFKIEIEKGRISYKTRNNILVEKSGKDNYEAGNKMLDWIARNKKLQCRYKA